MLLQNPLGRYFKLLPIVRETPFLPQFSDLSLFFSNRNPMPIWLGMCLPEKTKTKKLHFPARCATRYDHVTKF